MPLGKQVNILARRKIVFVIVEGPSDEEALGLLLNKIFTDDKVHVHITYGDVTSERKVNSQNIMKELGKIIKKYQIDNSFNKSHFNRIIHIVDMDGAYIPDSKIFYEEQKERTIYTEKGIFTANPQGIITRNQSKRECLNVISQQEKLSGIPYQVYYMSCNLDHVLHNRLNISDADKEKGSIAFARKYKENVEEFKKLIAESDFSVSGGYLDSWKYIKKDMNSINRHTNLGLAIV